MKRWFMNTLEGVVCRTIGCGSIFARWFAWPYTKICNPLAIYNWEQEKDETGDSARDST